MSIAIHCEQCGASFHVSDAMGGQRGRCPKCKTLLEVPHAGAVAAVPTPKMAVPPSLSSTAPRLEAALASEAPRMALPPSLQPAEARSDALPVNAPPVAIPTAPPARPAAIPVASSVRGTASPTGVPRAKASVAPVAIPVAAPTAAPGSPELCQELLAAFRGNIEPVKEAPLYRVAAGLVAVVMVLLPLVYIALIGVVCYVVYYHTINHVGMLNAMQGRGAIIVLLAYLAPLVVGSILVLFMVKPLFARSAASRRQRSLTRDGEPLLFAFVDRICEAVGAPAPIRIDVNCEINASASFPRGWFSLFGNDLVLTLGMPLAAGLSMQQFAGVLAHEFGHFTQGVGMRLTYVIRTISFWFTRVVYERDRWDEWLANSTDGMDLRIAWVLYLAKLFVWLTRKVLWVLMMIGHAVAGFMLRQMEFDADRHEARLAGSDTFAATARQLVVLNVAYQGAQHDLHAFMHDGRLGDDLPRLMLVNVEQLPADVHEKIDAMIKEGKTGLLDTHPCDRERIEMARRENAAGIFRCPRPAADLFRHFEAVSKNVTWDLYCDVFGPEFKPQDMHPLDELLARQAKDQDAAKTLERYLLGSSSPLRPIAMPMIPQVSPEDPRRVVAQLKDAIRRMTASQPAYAAAYKAYDDSDTCALQASQAAAALESGLRIRDDAFPFAVGSAKQARQTRDQALAGLRRNEAECSVFEQAAADRLLAAMTLLQVPQLTARLPELPRLREEAYGLLPVLNVLSRSLADMLRLRNSHAILAVLASSLAGNERNEALISGIRERMEEAAALLADLDGQWRGIDYPFDHAKGPMSLREYLVPKSPGGDDLGGLYEASQEVLEKLPTLYVRVAGRLAAIAMQVETAVGLGNPAP